MEIQIEFDVPAEMRDGKLRADVYRPGGTGPWPALLSRLSHGQQTPMMGIVLDPLRPSGHRAAPLRSDLRMEIDRFTTRGPDQFSSQRRASPQAPSLGVRTAFPRDTEGQHTHIPATSAFTRAGSAFFTVS